MFEVRKTYNSSIGLSCAFRQWGATSHCRFVHGYSLKVVLVFRGEAVDHRHWLVDFGGLKETKKYLEDTFDHKMLVAKDDPEFEVFKMLADRGLIQATIVDDVGCEAFAKKIFIDLTQYGKGGPYFQSALLKRVEIHEHDGNMAAYERSV